MYPVFCSYTDPVDGSKASNQGIRIMFTGEKLGRFVFFNCIGTGIRYLRYRYRTVPSSGDIITGRYILLN